MTLISPPQIPQLNPLQNSNLAIELQQGAIERGIIQTVAYADIFDFPLTPEEIYRYLVGVTTTLEAFYTALQAGKLTSQNLEWWKGYVVLRGRQEIIETRKRRMSIASSMWPKAIAYGRQIAKIPFVRMIAVTGALAVHNVDANADLDFLVVTQPGRLWLCRALVILLVRWAARQGDVICPNYFLSLKTLQFADQNLYTAHELAQMVPLYGLEVYWQIRRLNSWTESFLPNATGIPSLKMIEAEHDYPLSGKNLAEALLNTPVGGWAETWEMKRKIRKFTQQNGDPIEIAFCADWCKGHFNGHRQRTLEGFAERMQKLRN